MALLLIVITVSALLVVGAVVAYTTLTLLHEQKSRDFHDATKQQQSADQAALAKATDSLTARANELQNIGSSLSSKTNKLNDRLASSSKLATKLQGDVKTTLKALDAAWASLNSSTSLKPLQDQLDALQTGVNALNQSIQAAKGSADQGQGALRDIVKASGFIKTVQDKLMPDTPEMLLLKSTLDGVDIQGLQSRLSALKQAVTDLSAQPASLIKAADWDAHRAGVNTVRTEAKARLAAADATVQKIPSITASATKCQGAKDALGRVGGLMGVANNALTVNAPVLCVGDVCMTQAQLVALRSK
jgi:hypothetical protein